MARKTVERDNPDQSKAFIEKAKEIEAGEAAAGATQACKSEVRAYQRFDMGSGQSLSVAPDGTWIVIAAGKHFRLQDEAEFYRAWLLFERSYSEVEHALAVIAREAGQAPFPFVKLIASALKSGSRLQVSAGMPWVGHLSSDDRIALVGDLAAVRDAGWVDQKSRQLARRYAAEIERRKS